jgi:hypothetical protein
MMFGGSSVLGILGLLVGIGMVIGGAHMIDNARDQDK